MWIEVVNCIVDIKNATVHVGSGINVTTINSDVVIYNPTIATGIDVVINPTILNVASQPNTPTVLSQINTTTNVTTINSNETINTPTIFVGMLIQPQTINSTITTHNPIVTGTSNVDITTLNTNVTINNPTINTYTDITINPVFDPISTSINEPIILINATTVVETINCELQILIPLVTSSEVDIEVTTIDVLCIMNEPYVHGERLISQETFISEVRQKEFTAPPIIKEYTSTTIKSFRR